jgi:hypothetical protein
VDAALRRWENEGGAVGAHRVGAQGAKQPTALFRLTVRNPVAGATYSLQGKAGVVVDARKTPAKPDGKDIVFEVPVRIAEGKDGPRVLGDFVRTEGKTRRFFYVATSQQAGDAKAAGGRRAKIDFPEITPALAARAAAGGLVMEAGIEGRAKDGGPAAATVKLSPGWSEVRA